MATASSTVVPRSRTNILTSSWVAQIDTTSCTRHTSTWGNLLRVSPESGRGPVPELAAPFLNLGRFSFLPGETSRLHGGMAIDTATSNANRFIVR
jgi:hypothetical protein